jgi:hypothetical protein
MSVDISKLKGLYGRLKGIREILAVEPCPQAHVGHDYNTIVNDISQIIEEDCSSFLLPSDFSYTATDHKQYTYAKTIIGKLFQFLSYLEYSFNLSEKVIEVGSIYNSIKDEELKSRCSDILSSSGNFDRVINQATLVIEDRIRTKSKLNNLVGANLVNKAINSDIKKSVLQIGNDPEEHEGIAHICRGIVLSFRNPTHHKIIENYTREDALKFCAFVDLLLMIIEKSKFNIGI